jgi:hypothetical protein
MTGSLILPMSFNPKYFGVGTTGSTGYWSNICIKGQTWTSRGPQDGTEESSVSTVPVPVYTIPGSSASSIDQVVIAPSDKTKLTGLSAGASKVDQVQRKAGTKNKYLLGTRDDVCSDVQKTDCVPSVKMVEVTLGLGNDRSNHGIDFEPYALPAKLHSGIFPQVYSLQEFHRSISQIWICTVRNQ